jgi:hypothetical protein
MVTPSEAMVKASDARAAAIATGAAHWIKPPRE